MGKRAGGGSSTSHSSSSSGQRMTVREALLQRARRQAQLRVLKKQEALKLIEEHDIQRTGTIGEREFLDIMTQKIQTRNPEEELRKAFELFDEDGTGRITLRNMRRISRELGENLSDDELQSMIDEFDMDQDGEISLEEFSAIMKTTSLYD